MAVTSEVIGECPIDYYGHALLLDAGFRITGDYRPEKVNYKIREAQMDKIPYMFVVGEKEQATNTVAVRDRVDGDQGALPVEEALTRLTAEVKERRIRQVSTASAGLADSKAKFEQ